MAREFWIELGINGNETMVASFPPPKDYEFEVIHVIEKSVCDALAAKLAIATATLEILAANYGDRYVAQKALDEINKINFDEVPDAK